MKYSDYLKTTHWSDVKARHYSKPSNCFCKRCGSEENLHVHHRRYIAGKKGSVLFREKSSMLRTLCASCHKETHRQLNLSKKAVRKRKALEKEAVLLAKLGAVVYYKLYKK